MLNTSKISLCLHDVRVSGGNDSIEMIKSLIEKFNSPLTVHLVFDAVFDEKNPLYAFLKERVSDKRMEIVFHGINHRTSGKVKRYLSFYHKYEAEYIVDSDELANSTIKTYKTVSNDLGEKLGICPSCWLATKKNMELFKSLSPLYIESLFHLKTEKNKMFSEVISLASPYERDLFFLRLFAKAMKILARNRQKSLVRVAVHPCDLKIDGSIGLLYGLFSDLVLHGAVPVLQKELLD